MFCIAFPSLCFFDNSFMVSTLLVMKQVLLLSVAWCAASASLAQTVNATAGDSGNDAIMAVSQSPDGGWMACGRWYDTVGDHEGNLWLWKWDAAAVPVASTVHPLPHDQTPYNVISTSTGKWVAVGVEGPEDSSLPNRGLAAVFGSDAALEATHTLSQPYATYLFDVTETASGELLAVGAQNTNPDSAIWVRFNSSDLQVLEQGKWVIGEEFGAQFIEPDGNGGWYVAGGTGNELKVSHHHADMTVLETGSIALNNGVGCHGLAVGPDGVFVAGEDRHENSTDWRAGLVRWSLDLQEAEVAYAPLTTESATAAVLLTEEPAGGVLVGYADDAATDLWSPFAFRFSPELEWTGGGIEPISNSVIVRDAILFADQILFAGDQFTPDQARQGWLATGGLPLSTDDPSPSLGAAPNPTDGIVLLHACLGATCRWFTATGVEVTERVGVLGGGRFDLNALPNGVYIASPEPEDTSQRIRSTRIVKM